MSKSNVNGPEGRETIEDPVTELLRVGAQQLIQRAVEAELAELLSQHGGRRTETGNAGVVRNGYLPERELQTGLGPVTVQIPKVRAKTGEAVTFRSALVPPYIRKTKSLEAAVPWLYLKGVSSGEMQTGLFLQNLAVAAEVRRSYRNCPGVPARDWSYLRGFRAMITVKCLEFLECL